MRLIPVTVIILAVVLLVGQTTSAADVVNIYSARNEALIKPLLDRYAERTGVEINLVTGSADALIKRLELEGINSPADLLLTVDVGRLFRAKSAGLLRAVSSDILDQNVPEIYRDSAGYWVALSLRSRVIIYAPDRVDESELSSYQALAQPKWRGRVCIRSSSNIYNQSLIAAMIAQDGREATETWVRGLVNNMARPPAGGDRDQIKAIVAGQCDVAVINHYYLAGMLTSGLAQDRETAEQVRLFWPDQEGRGAHINASGAGVTRAAKNVEAAIALLEFLVSPEAQSWYADTNNEYPVRGDVDNSELQKRWGDFKADQLALEQLGVFNAEAVRLMDRAGWK
ncbi:MAG: Fe(3+) ABC transporter substrate-binding protein [Pseudomonadales bacterium]